MPSVRRLVTVAIPVRNGAAVLDETLGAIRSQRLAPPWSLELLVCDSGSGDGSVALARSHGAEVIEIVPGGFSHGATRNLLMERSRGELVAFLSQDAVPADEHWLKRLVEGFSLADEVALVFGPYRPRADASPMVARELTQWFASFSPDHSQRIDRLAPAERDIPAGALIGARGFFTDANGCVAKGAWESVPFRPVAYAEDHLLAHAMMRAGYAKVFLPDAQVIHSHEYSGWDWLRRSFDEGRALMEVYGYAEPLALDQFGAKVWGRVRADWRWAGSAKHSDTAAIAQARLLARSAQHHLLRSVGAALGGRSERLPPALVKRLSLEGRGR